MNIKEKKLVIFDLDGTLAPSKSPMTEDMGQTVVSLLAIMKVAVISGGGFLQFQTQFLASLPGTTDNYSNLFLLPTSGTRLYIWKGNWYEQYAENLSPQEKAGIIGALNVALKSVGYVPPATQYGDLIEDRGSQITFSALGQKAPIELKSQWDPTRSKRERIIAILQEKLPGFDCRIGGTTSVDITRRGVNKAYGIRRLEEFLHMPLEDMVFVGDALFHGGNDYPAKATGIDCIAVTGPQETLPLIRNWLT